MAKVVITLVGHSKESFAGPAVTIDVVWWGHSGVDFGKEVELAEGTYVIMMYSTEKAIHIRQAHVPYDGRFPVEVDIKH